MIYSIASVLLGLMFYQGANRVLAYYFFIVGIVSLCFFQLYQKWYYKRYYKKYIRDTYKNRFGITVKLSFSDDHIATSDPSGESKINFGEIENVTETGDYFYLKMRMGGNIIIPKLKLADVNHVQEELKGFCKKLSVDFIEELNWKWK